MNTFLSETPQLLALGGFPEEILKTLLSDKSKSDTLQPLVIALKQEAGESVRAPAEVMEVAADIREKIQALRKKE